MSINKIEKVASIIADSGGRVVGRTRLQKIAYLLTVTGMEDGFTFSYKHYGPYSRDLASAADMGDSFGLINEAEYAAAWGGTYSVYTVDPEDGVEFDAARREFARTAAEADAIELELAATAVFLAGEGYQDAWEETARRKPDKVVGNRLNNAKQLLRNLSRIEVPQRLPEIV